MTTHTSNLNYVTLIDANTNDEVLKFNALPFERVQSGDFKLPMYLDIEFDGFTQYKEIEIGSQITYSSEGITPFEAKVLEVNGDRIKIEVSHEDALRFKQESRQQGNLYYRTSSGEMIHID